MPEPLPAALIRWGAAGPLVLTSLAIMGSPGPATISLTVAGSTYGVRRSLGYLAGILAGTTIVLLAVASGITVTLLAVPGLRLVLVGVSVAYILWLAYHIAAAPPLDAGPATPPTLAGGTVFGLANPKAWIAIAAVFASAHLTGPAALDAGAKVALLIPMIVLINTTWLLAGASLTRLLRTPRRARVVNVALAAALVAASALVLLRGA
jgi:threonine/homoserine/homoserine lactone efflux protein